MKKMILVAMAAVLLAVPAVQAQKVNAEGLKAKTEKCDADVANPKKNTKAATWMTRGKAYYDVAVAPTKDIFVDMPVDVLKLSVGAPASQEMATLGGQEYEAWVYPYFTAYVRGGKVATWVQTREVLEGAVAKAIESYNKAYELDAKQAEKVKAGLDQIVNYCEQLGNTLNQVGQYKKAADAFVQAFEAQQCPAVGKAEPMFLYNAGMLLTIDGSQNPASFAAGAEQLNKALDLGYADDQGNIYYYLFHCYYGQREADKAFVLKGKDALLAGIEKFPKNERILEGLMQLYTAEEGVGDPADLVAMIDKSLAEQPDNVDLWFGRGRVFYALKNFDESIASFKKVTELKPDLYEGQYYLGVFYTLKGDALNKEFNARPYSSQAAYDADLKAVNAVYMEALPCFEKALALKPNDPDTLEFLKSLCFRLRDEPGMMPKYEQYNAQWKAVTGR